jgi:S1-C subfamily serine protease
VTLAGTGLALAALDRHEEALRAFASAVRTDSANALLWGAMARSAERVGRAEEAVSYWERALREEPGYFDDRSAERALWEQAIARVGVHPPAAAASLATSEPRTSVDGASANDPTSSGSGFFVSRDGLVLTNKHVVKGCSSLRVRADSARQLDAAVLALDPANDLALLRVAGSAGAVASFRDGSTPRAGEDVVAVGYPLSGLLADQVHVSTGSINALAGMYNDERVLQMSAPVQPGSSGGPLFDASANVVGVVVTKLNAKVVAEAMGDIPQNVNFALKAPIATAFLDANGVRYERAESRVFRSNADVGEIGRKITVLVECWR